MRIFKFLSLPCLLISMLAPMSAQADKGLTFDSNRKAITAKPNALKTTVPYSFENTSKRTITIARWDSACSCLNARIKDSKMVYKPGEKGEILIDFELGSFSGTQEKTVMLWTKDDAPQAPSTILAVAITIPVLFEVTPKTIFWDKDGAKETKTFKLKVKHDKPIRILSHRGTNATFAYTLKTIKDGSEYELVVTPTDVSSPAFGIISLTTDAAIKRYQRQQAFVCVRVKK